MAVTKRTVSQGFGRWPGSTIAGAGTAEAPVPELPLSPPMGALTTNLELTRILVTDDCPDMLRLVERALGTWNVCEFASSIDEAREKLSAEFFHLALCYFEMPDESDLILVGEIIGEHPDTAIVLITGEDSPEIAEHTFGLGAHGYLVKPFWPGQLLITTMNALRRRELEMTERARSGVLLASAEKRAEQFRDDLVVAQQQAIDSMRDSRRETVERLAIAIEMHDAETGRHVTRMASIASSLGRRLGLEPKVVLLLREGSPMHDVGKIATPDRILKKPGPLTVEEREQVQEHTTIGHRILADSASDLLRMAATIALTHHERWDGSGYPNGLEGEEIPIEGRITAVADAFDALLSDRSYRPAVSPDEAIAVIAMERGTHFDPHVVDVFLDHIEEMLAIRREGPGPLSSGNATAEYSRGAHRPLRSQLAG